MWPQAEVGLELLCFPPSLVCLSHEFDLKSGYAANNAHTLSLFTTATISVSYNKVLLDTLQTSDVDSSFLRHFETGNRMKILQIGIERLASSLDSSKSSAVLIHLKRKKKSTRKIELV